MSSWLPSWLKRQEPPEAQTTSPALSPKTAPSQTPPPNPAPRPPSSPSPSPKSSAGEEHAALTHFSPAANTESDESDAEGPLWSIPVTGFGIGFCAGMYSAAGKASLIFMAENAHRRPETVQGWYFYNKTKNYRVLLAAAIGGLKAGTRVGAWTLAWVGVERGVGELRNRYLNDLVSGLKHSQGGKVGEEKKVPSSVGRWLDGGVAGLGIATGASLLYRLSGPLSRRAIILATATGASVGALRDLQERLAAKQDS